MDLIDKMVRQVRARYREIKELRPNAKVEWTQLLGDVVRSHGFVGEDFTKTLKALNKAYSESKAVRKSSSFSRSWRRAS